jgi:hypothetical protein
MTIYVGPRIKSATGGSISTINGYTVHTFSSSGTFIPRENGLVEVLVVGTGGASGNFPGPNGAGGGGGGSVIYQKLVPVLSGVAYTMSIGALNTPNGASTCTYNGGTITAPGGGPGGGASPGIAIPGSPNPLGSGGGGNCTPSGSGQGGLGANIVGLGFSGGAGVNPISNGGAGGGGGAGGVGNVGALGIGGVGGIGVSYSITGVSTFYGGGGFGSSPGTSSIHPTSFPTMFGLGASGGNNTNPLSISANPGCIIIRYII